MLILYLCSIFALGFGGFVHFCVMLSYVIASCSPCVNTWNLSLQYLNPFLCGLMTVCSDDGTSSMQSHAASLPLAEWKVVIILHSLPWRASLCLVLYNYCVSWGGLRHRQDDNTSINTTSLCSDGKLLLRTQRGRQAELSDNTAHHRRMWAGFHLAGQFTGSQWGAGPGPELSPHRIAPFLAGRSGAGASVSKETQGPPNWAHIPLWLKDWLLISDY